MKKIDRLLSKVKASDILKLKDEQLIIAIDYGDGEPYQIVINCAEWFE